ncbi:oxysterol-binding protein 1 [Tetranychus urticae]|uniref:PH domain-containing protein n=1 Tax=Tetranychus urticae TaxID=32264 RepID=T1KGV7_TETUR|nr:oxysterol-binding protein 1 [Tetranychus urticae]
MAMANYSGPQVPDTEMKGTLQKWANYMRGYQKRWFVLSKGLLSYYSSEADVSQNCRGSIKLASAIIYKQDNIRFVVQNGDQVFHLKAKNEQQRQNWMTALQCSKMLANRLQESEDEYYQKHIINSKKQDRSLQFLEPLNAKLNDLTNFNELIVKHGSALHKSFIALESIDNPVEAIKFCKSYNEKATVFRVTTIPMLKHCEEFVTLARNVVKKMEKLLNHEREARTSLEVVCAQLAKQYSQLEERVKREYANKNNTGGNTSDEDEFFEDAVTDFEVPVPGKALRASSQDYTENNCETVSNYQDDSSGGDDLPSDEETEDSPTSAAIGVRVRKNKLKNLNSTKGIEEVNIDVSISEEKAPADSDSTQSTSVPGTPSGSGKNDFDFDVEELKPPPFDPKRRTKIPERPNQSLNLWSFMKNCIGKELTKIPMPVNFNEPLSMLQRLTEDFEYAHLLHKAATIDDSCNQLVYIAAFCVSSYATTSVRLNKPFNPLLGETYECDRTSDLGWKSIAEQVSHHPPMLALHCEGKGWKCWSEFGLSSKFRGKYLQVNPVDISHLEFPDQGYHYTWHKVTTTIHNIIVGKLWVDNHGDMVITNHTTGDRCLLKFIPYSYFSRDVPRKVTGSIIDAKGEPRWVIQGTWDNRIEAARVHNKRRSSKGKPIWETSSPKLVWQRIYPPPEYDKMYNLTVLAVQLNEPEDGVAPTDSRLRPDQRLMEDGKWDEANQIKGFLEEKQRKVRRKREEEAAANPDADVTYAPTWFKLQIDPITNNPVHVYAGDYWQCKQNLDWTKCPEIFNFDRESDLKSIQGTD